MEEDSDAPHGTWSGPSGIGNSRRCWRRLLLLSALLLPAAVPHTGSGVCPSVRFGSPGVLRGARMPATRTLQLRAHAGANAGHSTLQEVRKPTAGPARGRLRAGSLSRARRQPPTMSGVACLLRCAPAKRIGATRCRLEQVSAVGQCERRRNRPDVFRPAICFRQFLRRAFRARRARRIRHRGGVVPDTG